MPDRDPIWDESGPVFHWLGLGRVPPEGLHGYNRKRLTNRYTLAKNDPRSGSFGQALARTYLANREVRLMALLRPQQLDDQLWRMIYAVMVTGGPINRFGLVRSLARLVSSDHKVAHAEAVRLYRSWQSNVRRPRA